jgi:hypothetical protein
MENIVYNEIDNDDDGEMNYMKFVVKDRDTQKQLENYLQEISNKYFDQVDEEDLDYVFNVSVFQDIEEFITTFSVPFDDEINYEIIESIEEKFGDSVKNVPYYYAKGGFLGGIFGGKRTYKKGLAYKLDRAKHNKSEDWEVPMKNRKKRYENGGGVDEIGMFHNGVFYKLGYSEEDNFYIKDFQEDILKGVKEVGFDTEREARDYAEELIDSKFPNEDDEYANGGGVGELEIGNEVEIELNNGKIVKGKVEKTNPLKIRTDATSTQVIPNALIKNVKKYANGGGVDSYGVNYNIVFEKPDSDMAWKETINASSEKEAIAEFKKKHPTCTILNIFEAYANGGGVGEKHFEELYKKANNNVQGAMELYAGELGIYNMFYGHKVDSLKKAKVKKLQRYLENKYLSNGGGVGKAIGGEVGDDLYLSYNKYSHQDTLGGEISATPLRLDDAKYFAKKYKNSRIEDSFVKEFDQLLGKEHKLYYVIVKNKNKYANGGGEFKKYGSGGGVKDWMNEKTRAVIIRIQKNKPKGFHKINGRDYIYTTYIADVAEDMGIRLTGKEMRLISEGFNESKFDDGGGVDTYSPFRISVLDENGREQYEYFDDEVKAYERFVEYKSDFNDVALEKLVEGNEYETITSYDPDNDTEDNYEYGGALTDENVVMQNCSNGEIHCDILEEIIGSKPEYPYQQVGSIRLQKCYLRPYYKIS